MANESNKSRAASKQPRGFSPLWIFAAATVLLVAGVGLLFLGSGESIAKLGPRLAMNQDKIDLGKQPFDKTVQATFTITNTGDRTLTLDATGPVKALEGC